MKKESSTNLQKCSGIAEQMINWKDKYETCLNELKKETKRWWRF